MTNDEIIKFLQSKQIPQCGDKVYTADEEYEAYQRAIDALEQEPCIQEKQANADKIDAVYIDGFKAGYSQARFDLEQDPCDDAVSRKDAYEIAMMPDTPFGKHKGTLIRELPPVTPKSETVTEFADRCRECGKMRKGHWIWNFDKGYCKCSECGIGMGHKEFDYCPNCGAKMQESEESHTAMMMGIKALEQEPVLDKIRAEIEQKIEQERFARSVFRGEEKDAVKAEQCTGSIFAYNNMIKLIDKYKAESEEQE